MKNFYLSFIIPSYKEEKRIHKSLDAILEYQKKKDFETEVLVMIDGKTDNTDEVAKKYQGKIKNLKINNRKENRGKGYTVKEGMMMAKGENIIFLDADNSTPAGQVDKLLEYIDKYEVVIGSRYIKGGRFARPQSLIRRLGSRFLNIVIRTLAVRGVKDTQCGFKLFQKDAAKEIFKRMTFERWSFDIEVLAIAKKLGYKIKETGVVWYDDPHSVLNPFKAGFKMLRDAWVVRSNLMKGKYK